jgi:hypothetical protein
MKALALCVLLMGSAVLFAAEPSPVFAQIEPLRQIDMQHSQPRMMPLYEQGWEEGAKVGNGNSGKIGWLGMGLVGNIPFIWLPWVVEPRRPAKPPIVAEEEFNSGFKNGYRAGWKNAHKTFYIAGAVLSSAAVTTAILSSSD